MHNPITRLTAARFDGPQALYTEAVRLLSERPALPDDLAGLVARLREPWFTNGCEAYQREAADAIEALAAENARLAASEPNCAVVKPHQIERLVWEAMSWTYRHAEQIQAENLKDIPSYNETGNANSEVMVRGIAARILSAITLRPEAEAKAEAWAAAIEAAASECRILSAEAQEEINKNRADIMPSRTVEGVWTGRMIGAQSAQAHIRALTSPADISAALDRIKTEAKAKGMREAARIAKSRAGSPDYEPPSPYDRGYAAAVAEVERAILAAITEGQP